MPQIMNDEIYICGRNGPKPLGNKPMTSAEKQKRSRLKLKQEGGKEYQIKINKQQLDAIKLFASYRQTKTNQTIKTLLQRSLDHITNVMKEVESMNDKTDNEIILFMETHLFPQTSTKK